MMSKIILEIVNDIKEKSPDNDIDAESYINKVLYNNTEENLSRDLKIVKDNNKNT